MQNLVKSAVVATLLFGSTVSALAGVTGGDPRPAAAIPQGVTGGDPRPATIQPISKWTVILTVLGISA